MKGLALLTLRLGYHFLWAAINCHSKSWMPLNDRASSGLFCNPNFIALERLIGFELFFIWSCNVSSWLTSSKEGTILSSDEGIPLMTGTRFLVSEASENRVDSALKNIKQVMHEYWVVHSKAILPSRCRAFLAGYERKMESLRVSHSIWDQTVVEYWVSVKAWSLLSESFFLW